MQVRLHLLVHDAIVLAVLADVSVYVRGEFDVVGEKSKPKGSQAAMVEVV